MQQDYLNWAVANTKTAWWHDSADPAELAAAIGNGAVGATTNPYLANLALSNNRNLWSDEIAAVLQNPTEPERTAEDLMSIAIKHAAERLLGEYEKSDGRMGFVCAQVNPASAADRQIMLAAARRLSKWAPNIAVKLPATRAGLDVLEDCISEGITCTVTVSYTAAQTISIAERHNKGAARARADGGEPGRCFAVIMIGRLDDYLRDVAHDRRAEVTEDDIRWAGLAVTKRVYRMYRQRNYDAKLIVAAMRGTYHMTELAGAEIIMSIAVPYQKMLLTEPLAHEERINADIPADAVRRLSTIPDFVRAYEPGAMEPSDFISYGVTQRTLTQFHEAGWKLLENFQV